MTTYYSIIKTWHAGVSPLHEQSYTVQNKHLRQIFRRATGKLLVLAVMTFFQAKRLFVERMAVLPIIKRCYYKDATNLYFFFTEEM